MLVSIGYIHESTPTAVSALVTCSGGHMGLGGSTRTMKVGQACDSRNRERGYCGYYGGFGECREYVLWSGVLRDLRLDILSTSG